MGAGAVGDVLEDRQIAFYRRFVDHEAGRRHAGEVEAAEGARISGLGLHHVGHVGFPSFGLNFVI